MISISDFRKLFLLKRELKPGPSALITTALSTEAQLRGVQVVGIEGVNFTVINMTCTRMKKGFFFGKRWPRSTYCILEQILIIRL